MVPVPTALLNEKRQKESQITDLQDEISKIKATRTQLEERGQTDLLLFATNIKAISKIWSNVQNDAGLIRGWLLEGADLAVSPRLSTSTPVSSLLAAPFSPDGD